MDQGNVFAFGQITMLNLCTDKRNLASKCLLDVSTTFYSSLVVDTSFLDKGHKLVHTLQEIHRLFYSAVCLSDMRISQSLHCIAQLSTECHAPALGTSLQL